MSEYPARIPTMTTQDINLKQKELSNLIETPSELLMSCFEQTPFDPLSMNIYTATEKLLTIINDIREENPRQFPFALKGHFDNLEKYIASSGDISAQKSSISFLLPCISDLLLHPKFTLPIAQLYRPLLIDLVARWLLPDSQDKIDEVLDTDICAKSRVELVASAFSRLLPIAPQLLSLSITFFNNSPSLLDKLNSSEIKNTSDLIHEDPKSNNHLRRLLLTVYRLLIFSQVKFSRLWDWSQLFPLMIHADVSVRFLTILCLSEVLNLSDRQRNLEIDKWIGSKNEKIFIEWEDGKIVDLRMLTLLEQETLAKQQIELFSNDFMTSNSQTTSLLTSSHLSSMTVNICGVLLPRFHRVLANNTLRRAEPLISTKTTQHNLHSIALALSMATPVLLEGVAGSGKTSLVEEIANESGCLEGLIDIHLSDHTDFKVLLGTYISTSSPASFRWQPGIITTAVRDGRWVLIEDIDLASSEALSILLPLLETRQLFIPGRGERIHAKEGFQLFATRSFIPERGRMDKFSKANNNSSDSLWTKIKVNPLSDEELAHVIQNRFPALNELTPSIMHVYKTILSIYKNPELAGLSSFVKIRHTSARDLMKWCHRINFLVGSKPQLTASIGLAQNIREDLFSEAADCFCGMIPDYESWISVLEHVGEALGISKERVRFYIDTYIPKLDIEDNIVKIGRSNLMPLGLVKKLEFKRRMTQHPFANTSHALRLLEKLAVCVHLAEPVLLVGETGTGKTTVVQRLAELLRQNLVVLNLSQQSDSSDLLGGFKPIDIKVLATPLKDEFDTLFERTFSVKRNPKFLDLVRKTFVSKKYDKFASLLQKSVKMAEERFNNEFKMGDEKDNSVAPKHSNKPASPELRNRWKNFAKSIDEFQKQHYHLQNKFMFSFVEGSLVNAVKKGHWILLDELNLAPTETLECLSGLLQNSRGSLLLTEKGDIEAVTRHPNFRIFACMNPATDVGKRELPPGLRSRFTEFYVHSPDSRRQDLVEIVKQYLSGCLGGEEHVLMDVVEFYLAAKELLRQHKLVDSTNQRPHLSMRNLSRALTYASQIASTYGLRRSLYEGFCMTFLTQLNKESEEIMHRLIETHLLNGVENPHEFVNRIPSQPSQRKSIQIGTFWLDLGVHPIEEMNHYILTPSVEENLNRLSRIVTAKRFPALIQGPTSAGKTSIIEYLAKRTGHRFVRINNHEHTDLQEYLGTYVSNPEGKLEFQEGVLIEALKNGYWIVLDELNLAPSDVLEALNRLLDDNRELLIPETQEVVKPHENFRLFATQNPPGLYGGRKVLSRAFRNRFLELYFHDIPEEELETILSLRCNIAPSYGKRLVQVYRQLMQQRQITRIFEQKHGYITLRDLFRWAGRGAIGYQELAEHGYMILAERIRKPEEKIVVKNVLETVMKVKIVEEQMYNDHFHEDYTHYIKMNPPQGLIVWTKAMKRLFTLVGQCLRFNEPVLLIGETGCGKTTVCQILAQIRHKNLHILNCHQNTETADLLGGQRPVRNRTNSNAELKKALRDFLENHPIAPTKLDKKLELEQLIIIFERCIHVPVDKQLFENKSAQDFTLLIERVASLKEKCLQARTLFEWRDGALIEAMKKGDYFLLDEISLADDSVIERLNSILEPHRTLVLPEKGARKLEELVAADGFQFLATMNPGGDYGKKELSPALRNRFTEIWVPPITDQDDLLQIIDSQWKHLSLIGYGKCILSFTEWFVHLIGHSRATVSLRDILAWVEFMNSTFDRLTGSVSFIQGACLVLLDGLGSNDSLGSNSAEKTLKELRNKCLEKLDNILNNYQLNNDHLLDEKNGQLHSTQAIFGIHPFYVKRGILNDQPIQYNFQAPTTCENAKRVLRAMQLKKPILLEGSPGVGKTSLISALATAAGHKLVRINLSEQTDLMDLFGSDLPVEGGSGGEFEWRDAPFLQAMQAGDWVLLDELNLASQPVLEGLNSCLDHRASVYIPELDRQFFCANNFRVFAAQNPLQQGGGRKGLPKSFINRFTQVYIERLTKQDLLYICQFQYSEIDPKVLSRMIEFNDRVYEETMIRRVFGRKGSPWEFNLRDIFRWLDLMKKDHRLDFSPKPTYYLDIIYLQRMRTEEDREHLISLFSEIFEEKYDPIRFPWYHIDPNYLQIGHSLLQRQISRPIRDDENQLHLLQTDLRPLEAIMKCVEMNWMVILNGSEATGKTTMIRLLAQLTNNKLEEYTMNSSVDTVELLGGFEQVDLTRHREVLMNSLNHLVINATRNVLLHSIPHPSLLTIFQESTLLAMVQNLNELMFTIKNQSKFSTSAIQNIDYGLIHRLFDLIGEIMSKCKISEEGFSESIKFAWQKLISLQKLENESVTGRFEWIDGVLINALQRGDWLLIDNANLCNPSVLDRLNPLMEPSGYLMVNEGGLIEGQPRIIHPHPNFRLFMTVDPINGELSRAMRNRGVEITVLKAEWSENKQDLLRLANGLGFRGNQIPSILANFHTNIDHLSGLKSLTKKSSPRDYLMVIRFILERLQRGERFLPTFFGSIQQIYNISFLENPNIFEKYEKELAFLSNANPQLKLLNSLSPTNFPLFIGGTLLQNQSSLATITLHGAYLLHLLQTRLLNSSVADSFQSLRVVCNYLLESISLNDLELCTHWLDNVLSYQSSLEVKIMGEYDVFAHFNLLLKNLSQSRIATKIVDYKHQISLSTKLDPNFLVFQPLDITNNSKLVKILGDGKALSTRLLWNKYMIALKELEIFRRIVPNEYIENLTYQLSSRLKTSKLSLVHRSFMYHQTHYDEAYLNHPVIEAIYPFFEHSRKLLYSFLNEEIDHKFEVFSTVHDFLDYRDYFWKLCLQSTPDIGDLSTCVKLMREKADSLVKQSGESLSSLLEPIDSITKHVALLTGTSMKELWEYFHPIVFTKMDLFRLYQSLIELNKEFDFYDENFKEQKITKSQPVFELKEMLMEAISTLYFIEDHYTDVDSRRLLDSLQKVPEHLRNKIQDLDSNQNCSSVTNKGFQSLHIILDYWSIIKEMQILGQLQLIFASEDFNHEKEKLYQFIDQISLFRDFFLKKSTRPPLDFSVHQRLSWIYGRDSTFPNEKGAVMMNNLIQEILYGWHTRLWANSFNDISIKVSAQGSNDTVNYVQQTQGPSRLFQSVYSDLYFKHSLSLREMSIGSYDLNLSHLGEFAEQAIGISNISFNRKQIDIAFLILQLRQILNINYRKFTPQAFFFISKELKALFDVAAMLLSEPIIGGTYPNMSLVKVSLDLLSKALQDIVDSEFAEICVRYITPAVRLIIQIFELHEQAKLFENCAGLIGQAWILLALGFIDLYVPNYPLDPTSEVRTRQTVLELQQQKLQNEIEVRQTIQEYFTGELLNPQIEAYKLNLKDVNVNLELVSVNMGLRPPQSALNDLFRHIRHLCDNVINASYINELIRALEETCDFSTLQRENLFQAKTTHFIQRMTLNYPHYRDLIQPMLLAIYQLKYGLRTLAFQSKALNTEADLASYVVVKSLLEIPKIFQLDYSIEVLTSATSLASIKRLIFSNNSPPKDYEKYISYLYTILECTYYRVAVRGHIIRKDSDTIDWLLQEIAHIYLAAENHQRELEKDKEAFFRSKSKTQEKNIEDKDLDSEFEHLFPDFKNEFSDLEASSEVDLVSNISNPEHELENEEVVIINNDLIVQIGSLHEMLFRNFEVAFTTQILRLDELNRRIYWSSFNTASEVALISRKIFPEELDIPMVSSQILATALYKNWLVTGTEPSGIYEEEKIYNFYKDPNIPQTKRICSVISSIKKRVMELLQEWPQHAVLQHLDEVCSRIQSFALTSPLSKFLTGLELLLRRSEEWEAYASQEFSLKIQMQEISTLIVTWRQLELANWPKLLESQERQHTDSVYQWWFHLYNCVFTSDIFYQLDDEASVRAISDHVSQTVEVLDQFLQSAKLGDFEARLRLVQTFHLHLCTKIKLEVNNSSRDITYLSKTSEALSNVQIYYSQFIPQHRIILETLRKPIDQELKEFVKLASWKDVNVHALKQSAQKTHNHLKKCLRKFKEILSKPITEVILAYQSNISTVNFVDEHENFSEECGILETDNWIPEVTQTNSSSETMRLQLLLEKRAISVPDRFINIAQTLSKLRSYCTSEILIKSPSFDSGALEELSLHIILRTKTLQETTPNLMNLNNVNIVTNQKIIKKRSLVDLLKELQRLGLDPFKKKERVEQQENLVGYIFQLPRIDINKFLIFHKKLCLPTRHKSPDFLASISLLEKADHYYYQIIARISHLRNVASNPSRDLSSQEVKKCLSFTEHLLHLIISERTTLCTLQKQYIYLGVTFKQFFQLFSQYNKPLGESPALISLGSADEIKLYSHKEFLDNLVNLISYTNLIFQIQKEYLESLDVQLENQILSWLDTLTQLRNDILWIFDQVILYPNFANGIKPLMNDTILPLIQSNLEKIKLFYEFIKETAQRVPQLRHVMTPIAEYVISSINVSTSTPHQTDNEIVNEEIMLHVIGELAQRTSRLIDAVLSSVQALSKMAKTENESEPNEELNNDIPDKYIKSKHNLFAEIVKRLQLNKVVDCCNSLHRELYNMMNGQGMKVEAIRTMVTSLIQRTYPFIQEYLFLVQHHLNHFFIHHKSLCKFAYILTNLFTHLCMEGYCTPKAEAEVNEDASGQYMQGTGIGDGEGKKDVSEEIEDEEQVLGTQMEEENSRNNKDDIDPQENGIEMKNDFLGTLEDIERPDEESEYSDQSNKDEDVSEPEERMGQFDNDSDVIDEKMWEDEPKKLDVDNQKRINEENTSLNLETDIIGKNDFENNPEADSKKHKELEKDEPNLNKEQESEDYQDFEVNDDQDPIVHDEVQHQPTIEVPEAEPLELPDDLMMDEIENQAEENIGTDEDERSLVGMDLDETETKSTRLDPDEESLTEYQDDCEDIQQNQDQDFGMDLKDENSDGSANKNNSNEDEDMQLEEEPRQEKHEKVDEKSTPSTFKQELEDLGKKSQQNLNSSLEDRNVENENSFGLEGRQGKTTESFQQKFEGENRISEEMNISHVTGGDQQTIDEPSEQKNDGINSKTVSQPYTTDKLEQLPKSADPQQRAQDVNPHRSLGDAMKQWRERLGIVQDATSERDKENNEDMEHLSRELEYLINDEAVHDTQTVGPAAPDQSQEMASIGAFDDLELHDDHISDNVFEEESQNYQEAVQEDIINYDEVLNDFTNRAELGAILGTACSQDKQDVYEDEQSEFIPPTFETSHFGDEQLHERKDDNIRGDLEMELAEWRENGRDFSRARDLWLKYDSLTHDLAYGLCEQLRLILEPTMAARLEGDYRTGKRLNMKRIIPYIASDFKKDKIWLRRTKPSKRQYQIMIAVDDSKSMCESHSIQLAYETLALISKALSQLEVGAISIVSFGETVRMLHPFDQPFTIDTGAQVIQQFTFNQEKTNVRSLMETTIKLLQLARINSIGMVSGANRNAELWQLQLIISDGVCEDHKNLKVLVQQAAEAQIMVVFIIVDNKFNEKDSILSMNQVKYTFVDGRTNLKIERYLDSFPFDYYVVLRDINALPATLADALRQYFSIVSNV